jgi:hypothetical protein
MSELPAADMYMCGVFVKGVMRQVAHELVKFQEEMPRVYEHMCKHGVLCMEFTVSLPLTKRHDKCSLAAH